MSCRESLTSAPSPLQDVRRRTVEPGPARAQAKQVTEVTAGGQVRLAASIRGGYEACWGCANLVARLAADAVGVHGLGDAGGAQSAACKYSVSVADYGTDDGMSVTWWLLSAKRHVAASQQ